MSFLVRCDVPGCRTTVPAEVTPYDYRCSPPQLFSARAECPAWIWLEDDEEPKHMCPHHAELVPVVVGLAELQRALISLHTHGLLWDAHRAFKLAFEQLSLVA